MKTFPAASLLALVACASHVEFEAQERPPVIDMHMHAHHIPLDLPAGAPPPCLPRPCQSEGAATATSEESLQKTLEAMQRYNIVLAFLSSADLATSRAWCGLRRYGFLASRAFRSCGDLSTD